MNSGLPVIVSSGCGLADFVIRNRGGTVTDGSVAGLRSALKALLADEHLCRSMGQAGRRGVRRELSLDAFGERLEGSYRMLLERGPSPLSAVSPAL